MAMKETPRMVANTFLKQERKGIYIYTCLDYLLKNIKFYVNAKRIKRKLYEHLKKKKGKGKKGGGDKSISSSQCIPVFCADRNIPSSSA